MILYGHAESNAAWPVLLGESPVQVASRPGAARLAHGHRATTWRACSSGRGPAATGLPSASLPGSGLTGLRLTERLPYFTSGVAYPDCLLLGAKTSAEGSMTPIAAGYFGADWDVESGEFAWRD